MEEHTPQAVTESIRTAKNTFAESVVGLFPDLDAFSFRYRAGGPQFHSPGLEHSIPNYRPRRDRARIQDMTQSKPRRHTVATMCSTCEQIVYFANVYLSSKCSARLGVSPDTDVLKCMMVSTNYRSIIVRMLR